MSLDKWSRLKAWAVKLAQRRGLKRAKVALARKLAVSPSSHVGGRHRIPLYRGAGRAGPCRLIGRDRHQHHRKDRSSLVGTFL